jgi:hypothetical protein
MTLPVAAGRFRKDVFACNKHYMMHLSNLRLCHQHHSKSYILTCIIYVYIL